ncbi:hypothetical protein [Parasphingorhabdus halotolerans]|uniref:Uncharacterized protein n=1 Tax=Parasphingorhabdus halotolerans TaxID=2725558 RepID=A0A6H2DLI3_9SPHN|nr:hypothetical protein [Parasphingorhabdus halotolerans]QJB68516.1 hypothetical protein HF685_03775 [Parasphingorhabdus halotolerans]
MFDKKVKRDTDSKDVCLLDPHDSFTSHADVHSETLSMAGRQLKHLIGSRFAAICDGLFQATNALTLRQQTDSICSHRETEP